MGMNAGGRRGEQIAEQFMRKNGYTMLESNFRCMYGEIDLIMAKEEYVVFVEVKLRKNDMFAKALESVNGKKIQRLRMTAELWLQTHKVKEQPRFDIIEIYAPNGVHAPLTINHLKNAF